MSDKIWYKRVLIPLWVIQILVSLIFVAAAALALWVTNSDDVDLSGEIKTVLNVGAAVDMAFGIATILFDIIEMILLCAGKLGPVINIVFQSIKSAIWTVMLIVVIRGAAEGVSNGLSIFLVLAIFVTCIGQLIYGARNVHRLRKGTLYRGNYAPAGNTYYSQNYNQFEPSVGMAPQPDPFRDPSQTSLGYQAPYAGASPEYYAPGHVQQSYEMGSNHRY